MMTYYVDLTDDLFLVEKRRHGDEEEEEEPWEEQRFYCSFIEVWWPLAFFCLLFQYMWHHV